SCVNRARGRGPGGRAVRRDGTSACPARVTHPMMLLAALDRAPLLAAPMPPDEIDRETLARCQAGEAAALRLFVTRYQRPVFALLSRLMGRGPHVEDLAQETFLRAFRALAGFDPDGSARPSTWLLTIATRLALDSKKMRRLEARPLDEG